MTKQYYKKGKGKTFYKGEDFYAVMKWISDNVEIDPTWDDKGLTYDALRNKIVITIKYVA